VKTIIIALYAIAACGLLYAATSQANPAANPCIATDRTITTHQDGNPCSNQNMPLPSCMPTGCH